MFSNLLNRKPKQPMMDVKVVFHKDANPFPEHGTIYADHIQFGLINAPVRFALLARPATDMTPNSENELVAISPPNMTAKLMAHIWDEAEKAGFIVHCLRSYANIFTVQQAPNLNYMGKGLNAEGNPERKGVSRPIRRPSGQRAETAARQG